MPASPSLISQKKAPTLSMQVLLKHPQHIQPMEGKHY